MVLVGWGLIATVLLVGVAYVSWHSGREFGRDEGYAQGFNDGYVGEMKSRG